MDKLTKQKETLMIWYHKLKAFRTTGRNRGPSKKEYEKYITDNGLALSIWGLKDRVTRQLKIEREGKYRKEETEGTKYNR